MEAEYSGHFQLPEPRSVGKITSGVNSEDEMIP